MGTYNIPRDTKGEGRLFYIFSTKALIYTVAGIIIGIIFRYILMGIGSLFGASEGFGVVGTIFLIIFGILGFVIGTVKLPQNDRFEITKKAAGIKLDKIIIESIKFKLRKKKLYVYDTDELTREEIEGEIEEEEKNKEKEEELLQEKIKKASKNRRGYIR